MTKVSIKRLDSITKNDTTATEQINSNFLALQEAIENTLSRDGTGPNYMDADLDMNSYRIINSSDPVEDNDIVNLKYVEERIGGAVEASKTAVSAASQAASSAQSALVSSTNAINTLRNAEEQLNNTITYVDSAKVEINNTKNTAINTINSTVSTAKGDITNTANNVTSNITSTVAQAKTDVNSAIDEATMDISNIVSDAEGSITNIAVTEANKAIANAAQEATDMATANLNSYVDGTVKPSLQTYVDQAQEDANSAATSMEQAALSATAASNYASNASADADNAAESAGLAATSATDSEHYSDDSRIWAEGSDSEVKNVDGEHSSKVWSEMAKTSATSAASSAELAKQYGNGKINQTHITNCITEIPQDIKLELNNGTLTLKAGSKVYVPNGAGVFDVVTIDRDMSLSTTGLSRQDMFCFRPQGNAFNYNTPYRFYSGSVAPSDSQYMTWYDTGNNLVKVTSDGGSTWISGYSLPLGLFTSTSKIDSIDQVFNGFGYIGSTAFALPGVKGLIPNGRNADGSLKNIEFTVDKVITITITWNNAAGQELFIGKYNLNGSIQFISTGKLGQYYIQDAEPTKVQYAVWYKPTENKIYRCDKDSNGNLIWKDNFPCYIGQWFTSGTSPYPITKLTTKLPFRAVDYNEVKNLGATITYWE